MTERLFVVQGHNAIRAGLHWDLRFESNVGEYTSVGFGCGISEHYKGKILRSFVVPKHRYPEFGETLLAIEVDDHPWDYRTFEGTIGPGYGQGTVKIVHSNVHRFSSFEDKKISWIHGNHKFVLVKGKDKNKWFWKCY